MAPITAEVTSAGQIEGLPWLAASNGVISFRSSANLQPQLAAGLPLAIKSLCDSGGSANLAEKQNLHDELAGVVLDAQGVAGVHLAAGFGGQAVGFDSAEFTGVRCEGAGLEESSSPEPLVDPDAGHNSFSYERGVYF